MKILFITHRIPYPPNKGDKIRSFNILKYLSQNHSISLFCLATSREDKKHLKELEKYCKSIDVALISPFKAKLKSCVDVFSLKPLTLSYFYSRKLQKCINQRLQHNEFDVIYVFSSCMAQYVTKVEGIKKILDFVDIDSDKWAQYAKYARFPLSSVYRLESQRLRKYELEITQKFDCCIVVSEAEKKVFQSNLQISANIFAIPNGVDFDYFKRRSRENEDHTLAFTGAMDYFANVDGVLNFCSFILPLIKREIPEVKFYIVGNNPSYEIKKLAKDKNIFVTGFVEDIRPYLEKAAVCVVPLRIARGIQNKILEAMAMGVPVVATPQAAEGIEAKAGRDLFIENKPQRFAKKVIKIIRDRKLQEELSIKGRRFVEKEHSWQNNLVRLEDILEQTLNEGSVL